MSETAAQGDELIADLEEAMRDVVDPELGINVVDLGLVYGLNVEKGETEGKSLLDAMRDGETEGMQCFDGEIEKLIRAKVIDLETGISYSTNAGNLRLLIADLSEDQRSERNFPSSVMKPIPLRDTEIEIEK